MTKRLHSDCSQSFLVVQRGANPFGEDGPQDAADAMQSSSMALRGLFSTERRRSLPAGIPQTTLLRCVMRIEQAFHAAALAHGGSEVRNRRVAACLHKLDRMMCAKIIINK
jgi:hypothetical protein